MKIRHNINLASYTSFGIGGSAQYFVEAKSQQDLIEAVKWAKEKQIPWLILGQGSNVLISDDGFKGLAIKNQNAKIKMQKSPASPRLSRGREKFKIISDTGVGLAKLLNFALKHSLSGLEDLAGVPGTVGGAIAGNAGTKNGAIGQAVKKVTVLSEDGLIYDLTQSECQFAYRQSRFQKTKETILQVEFLLKKDKPELIKKRIKQILQTRKKQPQGHSAGSIFKNPAKGKAAGFLIDQCGLRREKIGQAQISPEHANWIINLGRAKAADVVQLIRWCQKEVKKKFKIELELEIKLIGKFR
jgi:UDP-N-acetylmuramate dehydrogenase